MNLVMFAWGNPSRGDDAVGPWFADRYRSHTQPSFMLVEDFQLQIEHILDCQQGELLLFVDAGANGERIQFEEITPNQQLSHTSHALSPEELLGQYQRLLKCSPPPAFQLTIPATEFELGQPMSARTAAFCETAAKLVDNLLADLTPSHWRMATS